MSSGLTPGADLRLGLLYVSGRAWVGPLRLGVTAGERETRHRAGRAGREARWRGARVVAFLASSDAEFVTGVTIDVTGGQ